ncbi:MAG TPA: ribbon-helix-helix protein, CopG family [Actinomycetota bacterium]|nr:ribbon-helix-helix protein, CopG family [Actinomycetota bacterium]
MSNSRTDEGSGRRKKAGEVGEISDARRVTVTLRQSDQRRLDEIAEAVHLSQNDVIRKALATEAFVQRVLGEGRKILVEDANGNVREVEFVT